MRFQVLAAVVARRVRQVGEHHHVRRLADVEQGLDGAVDRLLVAGALVEEGGDQFHDLVVGGGMAAVAVPDIAREGEARRVEPEPVGSDIGLEIAGEMDHDLVDVADDEGTAGKSQRLELAQGDVRDQRRLREFAAQGEDALGAYSVVCGENEEETFITQKVVQYCPKETRSDAEFRIVSRSIPDRSMKRRSRSGSSARKPKTFRAMISASEAEAKLLSRFMRSS